MTSAKSNLAYVKISHGGSYLDKPFAQFPKPPSAYVRRNDTNIYALNDVSKKALKQAGRPVPTTHHGWWDYHMLARGIGRSLAASDARQREVGERQQAGGSLRSIAKATSLSLRTVRELLGVLSLLLIASRGQIVHVGQSL